MADSSILPIEFVDLKKQRARIGDKIDAVVGKRRSHRGHDGTESS